MRGGLLELGQEVGALFTLSQHMIEDDQVGLGLRQRLEGGAAGGHAGEAIAAQRLGIETQLLGVVLDNQNRSHCGLSHTFHSFYLLPWGWPWHCASGAQGTSTTKVVPDPGLLWTVRPSPSCSAI